MKNDNTEKNSPYRADASPYRVRGSSGYRMRASHRLVQEKHAQSHAHNKRDKPLPHLFPGRLLHLPEAHGEE